MVFGSVGRPVRCSALVAVLERLGLGEIYEQIQRVLPNVVLAAGRRIE
jgi:hypothetical protein